MRLKSISNIAKITKSMKMIASTKVTKAQRSMETARAYGQSATSLFKHTEVPAESSSPSPIIVAVSSDRGLCGGIHSSIAKAVKKDAAQAPSSAIAVIGQKARTQIQRDFRQNIFVHFDQVTKVHPVWLEAALVADEVISARAASAPAAASSDDAAKTGALDGKIYYNQFKSVISYEATALPIHSVEALSASPKLSAYEVDDAVLKSFEEFAFANSLFWAIAEGYASEMAAKRTAMENATKNAGEMITKLTLTYNRSRQAAITNELIDIITGASSLN
ncbi:atp3 gamma subunit of the F1 sector of mitochondrial F1F0 ATP synthase [Entophlyctis luteolus]|nr:atp3 gamma subunit of the F1 sector of mitochondrial F1F0 ATP synthase [Entophlyctis luteolus]KAJ3386348.1 atp3 gamma subunit of the F1 sector of mitochondrial F1F0 ATP synthase [Entophlyctis sp. JEL0112]